MKKTIKPVQILSNEFTKSIGLPFQKVLRSPTLGQGALKPPHLCGGTLLDSREGSLSLTAVPLPPAIIEEVLTDICLWIKIGCDVVFRLHQGRVLKGVKKPKYTVVPTSKKRKQTRKCPSDRLILWTKPKRKPKDISRVNFDSLPKDLVLREVHAYICIPGFRTKEITVVTTLLDPLEHPASQILKLYDSRWQAEVNLKQIKTTLGMEILSCQTPEMVRKEISTYWLAYNLLRTAMYQAGTGFNRSPLRLSLQVTRQHLNNFTPKFANSTKARRQKLYQIMLEKIADSYQKKRVGRAEPRVRKRRPKAYPLMQEPRLVLQTKMKSA